MIACLIELAPVKLLEAISTASAYLEATSPTLVRGGAWCRRMLTGEDRETLREVAAATCLREVEDIANRFCYHVLGQHLAGEKYTAVAGRQKAPTVADAGAFAANAPPLVIARVRKSGKSGKSGRSNWVPWKGSARPGDPKWPSNFAAFPEWKKRQR